MIGDRSLVTDTLQKVPEAYLKLEKKVSLTWYCLGSAVLNGPFNKDMCYKFSGLGDGDNVFIECASATSCTVPQIFHDCP